WVQEEAPDVLCLQETKCGAQAVPQELRDLPELPHQYWASPEDKPGYSGVGLLARHKPLNVTYGIGEEEHDREGRVVTAEFPSLYVVAAYVPNAGRRLVRLAYRQRWDQAFRSYLTRLDAHKPIALCGDLNVAYQDMPHAYTFWTYLGGARERNVGWRLDYLVISKRLEGALCDSKIRSQVMGSDHCPITLLLAL
ncbi:APEX1 lyase, partial [Galbula dea]|nr:APEX1 lyase [Galbula dea]